MLVIVLGKESLKWLESVSFKKFSYKGLVSFKDFLLHGKKEEELVLGVRLGFEVVG